MTTSPEPSTATDAIERAEPAASAPVTESVGVPQTGGTAAAQRRVMTSLVLSQVLGGVGVSSGVAVGTLLAARSGGSTELAGLAGTASVLGSALVLIPMVRVVTAHGRRPALAMGYGIAAVGALIVLASAVLTSFPLQLFGMLLFGSGTAVTLQSRYAATDLAPSSSRARALSVVVWATTIGAVLGPNLTKPGAALGRSLGLPELAGPYIFSLVFFALAAIAMTIGLRPDPLLLARKLSPVRLDAHGAARRSGVVHSLGVCLALPQALLGLGAVAVAQTVMTSVMVMTPVQMNAHGAGLGAIGLVISVHILGMYALSPVSGLLADRAGRARTILLGQGVFVVALVLAGTGNAAGGLSSAGLGLGLFGLGFGWSLSLVAGSTLLTESVPEPDRPGVQAAADLVTGLSAAAGGALSGVILGTLGYGRLTAIAGALIVPVLVLLWRAQSGRGPRVGAPA